MTMPRSAHLHTWIEFVVPGLSHCFIFWSIARAWASRFSKSKAKVKSKSKLLISMIDIDAIDPIDPIDPIQKDSILKSKALIFSLVKS